MTGDMKVHFFAVPAEFRRWLTTHHRSEAEVWVGLHKVHTKRPSLTWKQAIDVALCFGWIDGVRYPIDPHSYRIRFTPRRTGSKWSKVNLKRAEELIAEGLMTEAGKAALELGRSRKTDYAFEQEKPVALSPAYAKRLKANAKAQKYFESKAPWYKRTASFWVMSAKQEATRERRLAELIARSAQGQPIGPLEPRNGK
jgi:uncharacterized protein YdeI (YjbR/CyaY-like superfamily)